MSNADIVGSFSGAVEGGDLAGRLALLALAGGTHRGPDEVREGVFFRIGSEWDEFPR